VPRIGCWINIDRYILFILANGFWFLMTEATFRYGKALGVEVPFFERISHFVICGAWVVLGYWFHTSLFVFLWVGSMTGCLSKATHNANRKDANTLWVWINILTLFAMWVYALLFTWLWGYDNTMIKFILNAVLAGNMTFFNFLCFKQTVKDAGSITESKP